MIVGIALVAVAAVAGVFGGAMITDALKEGKKASPASDGPKSTRDKPRAEELPKEDVPKTAAEKREAKRKAFVDSRRPLQEAVADADGELVTEEFDDSGIGSIQIPNGAATYTVDVSKNSGRDSWVYNTGDSVRRLLHVGTAQNHELIDVEDLPAVPRDISIPIGDTVVYEMTDGTIVQLLLVDAHSKANGDQTDDVRFRYQAYPAGTSQIRALRD